MTGTIIGGAAAALLTGIFSWLAARATASSQIDAKKVETAGPQWKDFTDTIMERLNEQQGEIDGLKAEVSSLRQRVEETQAKYWRAIMGLRRVFDRHPHVVEDAKLAADVHEDVFGQ